MITVREFGTLSDGRKVHAYTLRDGAMEVTVLDLGGAVQSIRVPDASGFSVPIALGYPTVDGYEHDSFQVGAVVGRCANRIKDGRLVIGGTLYQLPCNDRGNHLHGGENGFGRKLFSAAVVGDALALTYISPDGEEGYPGRLTATVVYTLHDGCFRIRYRATTEAPTAVNLTNHTYFNLNGIGSGDILGHIVRINSSKIVRTDETMACVGGFRPVAGTAFDFNNPKEIGRDIKGDLSLLTEHGYNHSYVRDGEGEFMEVKGERTGIRLKLFTDLPCAQFYTGNELFGAFEPHTGLCLEAQLIPNNVNVPEYCALGSSFLNPGEVYDHTVEYKFGIEK